MESEGLRTALAERDADAEVMLDRLDELESLLRERDDALRALSAHHEELGALARREADALRAENERLTATVADTERTCLSELGALRRLVLARESAEPASLSFAPPPALDNSSVGAMATRELRAERDALAEQLELREEELEAALRDSVDCALFDEAEAARCDAEAERDEAVAARHEADSQLVLVSSELVAAEREGRALRERERALVGSVRAAEADARTLGAALADADAAAAALAAAPRGAAFSELAEAYSLLSDDRRLLALELDELRDELAAAHANAAALRDEAVQERTELRARAQSAERVAARARVRRARGDFEPAPSRAPPPTAHASPRRAGQGPGAVRTLAASPTRGSSPISRAARSSRGGEAERRAALADAEVLAQGRWHSELAREPGAAGNGAERAARDFARSLQLGGARPASRRTTAPEGGDEGGGSIVRIFASPERKRWQAEVRACGARAGCERAASGLRARAAARGRSRPHLTAPFPFALSRTSRVLGRCIQSPAPGSARARAGLLVAATQRCGGRVG
jgi:hypothetical protein